MVEKNANELYLYGCEKIKEIEPNCYQFEVSQLLESVTGVNRNNIMLKGNNIITQNQINLFKKLIERRLKHEPLQYILGEWEFYGLPLIIGQGVLIPRPDTEIVAQTAINLTNQNGYENIADLCSGSGAIAIALAKHSIAKKVVALELSNDAVEYLKKNVEINDCVTKTEIIADDVLKWIPKEKLDLIVSNPPYIPTNDIKALDEEVLKEPLMALDGGNDGMMFYKEISKRYYQYLNIGGALVFEIGIDQAEIVADIMKINGYVDIAYENDILGIKRCVFGRR